jgi:hypothetical protein
VGYACPAGVPAAAGQRPGLHGVCLGAAGPALRAVLAIPKGEVILESA